MLADWLPGTLYKGNVDACCYDGAGHVAAVVTEAEPQLGAPRRCKNKEAGVVRAKLQEHSVLDAYPKTTDAELVSIEARAGAWRCNSHR
jgi:hypothetical protein